MENNSGYNITDVIEPSKRPIQNSYKTHKKPIQNQNKTRQHLTPLLGEMNG